MCLWPDQEDHTVSLFLSEVIVSSHYLRYGKLWTWKFSALSHGKGLVYGVVGRAKSLLGSKVISKRKDQIIVWCPEDFFKAASMLLKKTNIYYISQEMIDIYNFHYPLNEAHNIDGIFKSHAIEVSYKKMLVLKIRM